MGIPSCLSTLFSMLFTSLFCLLSLAGLTLGQGISVYFQVPIPSPAEQVLPLPASPGSSNTNTTPLVMGYYPDWAPASFPPSKVDFGLVDVVDFAFAVPDQSFNLTWDEDDTAPGLLMSLVSAAHAKGKRVKLSIGGWSGSKYFSSAVKSSSSRSIFVENILSVYESYSLDGVDIDWEYPGTDGNPGNIVSQNDTLNFLQFLQLLRKTLPQEALLTATATDSTWSDALGNPTVDVSAFAGVLDWVLLMNYDVNQASSHPGPNAPLSNGCHNSAQPAQNAESGFTTWTEAGFPASQLVLGVPSYGYLSKSNVTRLSERALRVTSQDGSSQVQFRDLVQEGALTETGPDQNPWKTSFSASGGFKRYWDGCSSTPFLQSSQEDQVVTYDDPQSLYMKAAFVRSSGMRGVNLFDLSGDTDALDLINSLREGLALP